MFLYYNLSNQLTEKVNKFHAEKINRFLEISEIT